MPVNNNLVGDPTFIDLKDFYVGLGRDHSDDLTFKRLESEAVKAKSLTDRLQSGSSEELKWLHSPIGPLVDMENGNIRSLVTSMMPSDGSKPGAKNEQKVLIQELMINQAQRFFDLLDLIVKYDDRAYSRNGGTIAPIKINDAEFLIKYSNTRGDRRLHFGKPGYQHQWVKDPHYEYKMEPNIRSSETLAKYHESGFDLRSSLHSFDLHQNTDGRVTFQQGMHDKQIGAKLRAGLDWRNMTEESASWYADANKQTGVIHEAEFLKLDQSILS